MRTAELVVQNQGMRVVVVCFPGNCGSQSEGPASSSGEAQEAHEPADLEGKKADSLTKHKIKKKFEAKQRQATTVS